MKAFGELILLSAPPSVEPRITQKMLNSLIRQNSPTERPAPKTKLWAHKVRHRHETLFSIALWYTGSGENWPRLAEANPAINPKRIHIGDTVLIPDEIVKTHNPMPARIRNPKRKHHKIKKPQPQNAHPPAKNDEATLFGPIENERRPIEPKQNDLPVPLETIDR
jgi:hypothetical protein